MLCDSAFQLLALLYPATRSTIARWIRHIIIRTKILKDRVPLLPVKAHCTRSVSATLAFQHQTFVPHICKAAIWYFVHTFLKSDPSFECKVL